MPFTFSHPAAVIPLARGRLAPSALVVGSMVPDLPYFVGLQGELREATHVPLGIVTIDVVLGLLSFAVFHLVWKRPVLVLAPEWLHRRLAAPAGGLTRAMVMWAPLAIAIGAGTHVLWDAFTHRHHSFAGVLPWLVTTSWAGLELFRWLQYLSGVGGAVIVLWWTVRWLRAAEVVEMPGRLPTRLALTVVSALFAFGVAGGLLGAATLINQPDVPRTLHMTLASGVEGAVAGLALGLTLYALIWRVKRPALAGA
ncbi:DUF4184 family protein [Spirillospora sp. NPDC047279]|uniref:DUF4184 family protein n=1 Tax=Spirillospora sp. NPDC047279 TaxID=3155478 RepID=UPI00340D1F03